MQHSLLARVFLVVFVSASIVQAAPWPVDNITKRPTYCPGVTANDPIYTLLLALSTVQRGSLTLTINVTHEDQTTTRRKLETYSESNYTKCLGYPSPVTSALSTPGVCSTEYQCDYDAGRFPQYIVHVVCKGERVKYSKGGQWAECQCRPIYRPIPVLRFVGCDPFEQWRMEEQSVSVGCSCMNTL